jgi:dissimilatory sulfite reductase (desulfoviridin) alpha/beta subunit
VIPFIEDHEKLLKICDVAIRFFEHHALPGERFKFTLERVGYETFEKEIREAYENG